MTAGATRRKGRPPKSEEGAATASLAMRVLPSVYEGIRRDAEANGRSISAQAERRVAYPEPGAGDVGRILDIVISATEAREGKTWRDDAATRTKCRLAAETVLNSLLGPPPPLEKVRQLVEASLRQDEERAAGGMLAQILGTVRPTLSADGLQEMIDVLSEAKAIRDNAESIVGGFAGADK